MAMYQPESSRQGESQPPTRSYIDSDSGFRRFFSRKKSLRNRSSTTFSIASPKPGHDFEETRKNPNINSPKTSSRSLTTTNTNPSSATRRPRPGLRRLASRDPPPLFQVYSQATTHATLSVPSIPTEKILRRDHNRRRSNADELSNASTHAIQWGLSAEALTSRKAAKHRRNTSGNLELTGWTRKLFLLLAGGYMLQYAADGHHDRLPEKILQLERSSVAFASDAIPGKPWVLHVAQSTPSSLNNLSQESEKRWSRMTFQSAENRRLATNLLLVFDAPEDFGSWMDLVRREIEALGSDHYHENTNSAVSKPLQITGRRNTCHHRGQSNPLVWPPKPGPADIPSLGSVQPFDFAKPRRLSLTASSVSTLNDLDALRSSGGSSHSTQTAPRTSIDDWKISHSPIIHNSGSSLKVRNSAAVVSQTPQMPQAKFEGSSFALTQMSLKAFQESAATPENVSVQQPLPERSPLALRSRASSKSLVPSENRFSLCSTAS